MLVKGQQIEIKWSSSNRAYYESKGYTFTDYRDSIYVRAEDLNAGSHKCVDVVCGYCGKEYKTEWRYYIKVINKGQKCACSDCKVLKKNDVTLIDRQTMLYDKLLLKCSENGYTLLTQKDEIQNNVTYIRYICPIHGEHSARISNFLNNKKYPKCAIDKASERYRLSIDEVKTRIHKLGGVVLNADEYKNNCEKNLKIICFECGQPFTTSLSCFEEHGGQVCPDCSNSESVGEKKIRHYLEDRKIEFITQKWFVECRDKRPLPFDFYLSNYNIIIEFDGRQHFGETNYFTYSFEETKRHDEIKNNYCKENGIYLIRIPYWNVDKIEQILDKELILHEDIV